MQLIEDNGLVSLYRGSNDEAIVFYKGEYLTLKPSQFFKFDYSFTWNPIIVDIFDDPNSSNDGNILMLRASYGSGSSESDPLEWEALSFSSQDGYIVGAYDVHGKFRDDGSDYENKFSSDQLGAIFGDIYLERSYKPSNKNLLIDAIDLWISNETKASSLYGEINDWDVSQITDFSELFKDKASFNSDLSNWDVSNGADFESMFSGATSFNQDISSWDVSSGINFYGMFSGATSLNQDLSSWTINENASLKDMFKDADLMQSNQGVGDTPSIDYFNTYINPNIFTNKTNDRYDSLNFDHVSQLIGNIWEWCEESIYPYDGFTIDPVYREMSYPFFGFKKICKGGCFAAPDFLIHPRYRNAQQDDCRLQFIGFRVCL